MIILSHTKKKKLNLSKGTIFKCYNAGNTRKYSFKAFKGHKIDEHNMIIYHVTVIDSNWTVLKYINKYDLKLMTILVLKYYEYYSAAILLYSIQIETNHKAITYIN